jgi:alkylation response protein AidB-like acyl-CoA dehydrogenase
MTSRGSDSLLERAHADPVALAASFAAEIRAGGDAMEIARCMPRDLAQRMAATGLFSMLVPAQYGGLQSHPRQFFEAIEATAKADGAVGWCLMIGSTTGLLAASLPEEHAGAIFSAQPDVVVSGVTAPNGIATRVDGGLEVSGRWSFGSACQVSDWISGGCFLHENGEPVVGPHGPQVLMPLFPAADVTIHDTWHTSGLCGTGSHDIRTTGVRAGEAREHLQRRAPAIRQPDLPERDAGRLQQGRRRDRGRLWRASRVL